MKPGDTFWGGIVGAGQHLHVVLSHPTKSNQLVVVTIIATRDPDRDRPVCSIEPTDGHSFIRHSSYVAYIAAKAISLSTIESKLQAGEIKMREPFSHEVCERILQGADDRRSRFPDACWLILDDQGLLPK